MSRSTMAVLGLLLLGCSEKTTSSGSPQSTGNARADWSAVPSECAFPRKGEPVTFTGISGDNCATTLAVSFSPEGKLLTLGSTSCEFVGGGLGPTDPTEPPDCSQEFDCGGCEYALRVMTNQRNVNANKWYVSVSTSSRTRKDVCPAEHVGPASNACEYYLDPAAGSIPQPRDAGSGNECVPQCDVTEYCSNGVCKCPSGCQQGTVCCGGPFCGGDCVGTPCCRQ